MHVYDFPHLVKWLLGNPTTKHLEIRGLGIVCCLGEEA